MGEVLDEAIQGGKVKREDLFVLSKIWKGQYKDVEGAVRETLKKLKIDYLDLYLIHWPCGYNADPKKPMYKLWAEMEALVDKGLTKSIGISNFNV